MLHRLRAAAFVAWGRTDDAWVELEESVSIARARGASYDIALGLDALGVLGPVEGGLLGSDQLDGGGTRQHPMVGHVHFPHPATAQQRAEPITPELPRVPHLAAEPRDDTGDEGRDRDRQDVGDVHPEEVSRCHAQMPRGDRRRHRERVHRRRDRRCQERPTWGTRHDRCEHQDDHAKAGNNRPASHARLRKRDVLNGGHAGRDDHFIRQSERHKGLRIGHGAPGVEEHAERHAGHARDDDIRHDGPRDVQTREQRVAEHHVDDGQGNEEPGEDTEATPCFAQQVGGERARARPGRRGATEGTLQREDEPARGHSGFKLRHFAISRYT